jgi:hypothetical protein
MDMKPSRLMEDQIIGILAEQEAGAKTADVCRKHVQEREFLQMEDGRSGTRPRAIGCEASDSRPDPGLQAQR